MFRLYYNNTWSDPQVASITAGEWTVYRFPVPSRLTALRLDPSDEAGAHAVVKNVIVKSGNSSASVAAQDLQHWLQSDLDVHYDPATLAAVITTRQRAGYLMSSVDIDLTRQTLPLLTHFRLNAISLLWCGLLLGSALLLSSSTLRDLRVAAGIALIVLASVAVAHDVAPRVLKWPAPAPDVSLTVGHESYFGQSKAAELRAMNAGIGAAVTLAIALGWLLRRRVSSQPIPSSSQPQVFRRADVIFIAICLLVFAVGSLPAATDLYRLALNPQHRTDFDSLAVLTWEYEHARGFLPWRDYWFPYSGMYDQLAPLYPDLTVNWVHTVLLFAVLLTSSFVVTGRRKPAVLALSAVWIYLEATGVLAPGASARYFLGVSVIVLAAAALNQKALWLSAGFGLWVTYVLQQEVSQLVYAAPGAAVLIAASVVRSTREESRRPMIYNFAAAAGACVLATSVFLLSLARHEQIAEWWEFVTTVDVVSNYSGWPANVTSWFSIPATLDQFVVLLTILLLVGGVLQALWTRFSDVDLLVPLAVGCLSLMLLQKQTIRPGIEVQILAVPVLGLGLLIIQQLRLRPAAGRPTALSAFSAAFVVSCFTWSVPSNWDRVARYLDITSGLLPDLEYTLGAAHEWKTARERFFAPASLVGATIRGDQLAAQIRDLTQLTDEDNIFVLGDRADVYIALRRAPAFYPNIYNQSPLFCQRKTIAWIHTNSPKYLIWDPDEKFFDEVPNLVRVPLLYNYAVARFVPLGVIDEYDVLRLRRGDEPPALAYWRDKLGAAIDLGSIPALSTALAKATAGGRYQMRYLIVRPSPPVDGFVYSIVVQLAGEPYTVYFRGRRDVNEYAIALDRLPFAQIGDEFGRPPTVDSVPSGVSAEIRTLRFPRQRLY
jgi:hypothetical protein